MTSRFFCILNLLLPVGLFAGGMVWVRELFDTGDVRTGLLVVGVALLVLALWEGLLIRYLVLPVWGRAVGERVYAGSYTPDQDALLEMAARIRRENASELLPELERLVRRESFRTRAWTELAALQAELCHRPEDALQSLLLGAEKVPEAEDRAFLLCRAAALCDKLLSDPTRAARLRERAATEYPDTAYGRRAASLPRA